MSNVNPKRKITTGAKDMHGNLICVGDFLHYSHRDIYKRVSGIVRSAVDLDGEDRGFLLETEDLYIPFDAMDTESFSVLSRHQGG